MTDAASRRQPRPSIQCTFRLSPELKAKLTALAASSGRSEAALVVEALDLLLETRADVERLKAELIAITLGRPDPGTVQ